MGGLQTLLILQGLDHHEDCGTPVSGTGLVKQRWGNHTFRPLASFGKQLPGVCHLFLRFCSAALLPRRTSWLGELVKRIKTSLIPISDNRSLSSSREDEVGKDG